LLVATVIEIDPWDEWSPDDDADRARWRRRSPLRVAVAGALIFLVAMTGPALMPRSGSLTPLWRADTETGYVAVTEDTLFQVELSGLDLSLTARDPRTGQPRWRAPLDGPLGQQYARGPVVLVSRYIPGPAYEMTTRVIDVTTGRRAWVFPASAAPLAYLGDDVAVVVDLAEPPPPAADQDRLADGTDRSHRIRVLDIHTGRPLWSTLFPPGTVWALPGVRQGAEGLVHLPAGVRWMLVTRLTGQAQVWDLLTGDVVARANIGGDAEQRWYAAALADTVVVRTDSPAGTTLTGYDPRDLSQRWRMGGPDVYAAPFDCGPLVCVESDSGLWALSPRLGGIVWHAEGVGVRSAAGPIRRLASRLDTPLSWVDVASGGIRLPDGDWRVVDGADPGRGVVVAHVTQSGFALLGLADPGTGAVRVLGEVRGWSLPTRCRMAATVLACADRELLRVWQVSGT
jgi:outer membrane protein assembly factor BamB